MVKKKERKKISIDVSRFLGVPTAQKIFFVQHLAVMLRAGIPLSKSLNALAEQASNVRFKIVLRDLADRVEKGDTLAQSLKRHPKVFSELFINMVEAGEFTGNLEEVLKKLYLQMKKDHELMSKARGAMIYPTVVVTAMIGVGIGMITYVIPRITGIFKELDAQLPLPTLILIAISDFVVNNGLLVTILSIAIIVGFFQLIRSKLGKPYWHFFLLKLPIISGMIKKINLARFSRTLSSLLRTNIAIGKTLATTANVLGNHWYRQALTEASVKIEKGVALSDIIVSSPRLFPPVVQQMILVGEQTGTLDTVMDEVAIFYEDEVANLLNNLTSVIEPILILILGVGVAFMAIAVLLPIYTISQHI